MGQYLPILVLGILGVVFVLLSIFASRLLAPSRTTLPKSAPYECGITDQVAPPRRFPVKFYLVAMLFIMFDIEIVFLYPWAVANRELGTFGLVAMLIFAGIFFVSFVYELALWNHNLLKRDLLRAYAGEPLDPAALTMLGAAAAQVLARAILRGVGHDAGVPTAP